MGRIQSVPRLHVPFLLKTICKRNQQGHDSHAYAKADESEAPESRRFARGTLETLLELNKMTFERKGAVAPFDAGLVLRLWEAAHARGQATLYVAKTDKSQPVAALLTVHDERTTYQIISGFNPSFPDVPGQNVVLWTALQDAIEAGRNYDFEGSSLRGVETFYRRWGGEAVPVWKIEKAGSIRGTLAHLAIRFLDRKRFST